MAGLSGPGTITKVGSLETDAGPVSWFELARDSGQFLARYGDLGGFRGLLCVRWKEVHLRLMFLKQSVPTIPTLHIRNSIIGHISDRAQTDKTCVLAYHAPAMKRPSYMP